MVADAVPPTATTTNIDERVPRSQDRTLTADPLEGVTPMTVSYQRRSHLDVGELVVCASPVPAWPVVVAVALPAAVGCVPDPEATLRVAHNPF